MKRFWTSAAFLVSTVSLLSAFPYGTVTNSDGAGLSSATLTLKKIGIGKSSGIGGVYGDATPISHSKQALSQQKPQLSGSLLQYATKQAGEEVSITLYSVKGQEIYKKDLKPAMAGLHSLNLTQERQLAAGIYVVQVRQGAHTYNLKTALTPSLKANSLTTIRSNILASSDNQPVGAEVIDTLIVRHENYKTKKIPLTSYNEAVNIVLTEPKEQGVIYEVESASFAEVFSNDTFNLDSLLLYIDITNAGLTAGNNGDKVFVAISGGDSLISIIDSVACYSRGYNDYYNEVDDAVSAPGLYVSVDPNTPPGHIFSFDIVMSDTLGNSFTENVSFMPFPFTVTVDSVYNDALEGATAATDNNGMIDPLEKAQVALTITPAHPELFMMAPEIQGFSTRNITNKSSSSSYENITSESPYSWGSIITVTAENNYLIQNPEPIVFQATYRFESGVRQSVPVIANLPTIHLESTPEVTMAQDTIHCLVGDSVTITANGTDASGVLFYNWYENDQLLLGKQTGNSYTIYVTSHATRTIAVDVMNSDPTYSEKDSALIMVRREYGFMGDTDTSFVYSQHNDCPESSTKTSDGGYIIVGETDPTNIGHSFHSKPIAIRIDSIGDTLWQRSYFTDVENTGINFQDVAETPEGDFWAVGYWAAESYSPSRRRAMMVKIGADGILLDTIFDDTTRYSSEYSTITPLSNGYVVTQNSNFDHKGDFRARIFKMDFDGTFLSETIVTGFVQEGVYDWTYIYDALVTPKGIVFVGLWDDGANYVDMRSVALYDPTTSSLVWSGNLGAGVYHDITLLSNGDILAAGETGSNKYYRTGIMSKIAIADGSLIQDIAVPILVSSNSDKCYGAFEESDTSFITFSTYKPNGSTYGQLARVKVYGNGEVNAQKIGSIGAPSFGTVKKYGDYFINIGKERNNVLMNKIALDGKTIW